MYDFFIADAKLTERIRSGIAEEDDALERLGSMHGDARRLATAAELRLKAMRLDRQSTLSSKKGEAKSDFMLGLVTAYQDKAESAPAPAYEN